MSLLVPLGIIFIYLFGATVGILACLYLILAYKRQKSLSLLLAIIGFGAIGFGFFMQFLANVLFSFSGSLPVNHLARSVILSFDVFAAVMSVAYTALYLHHKHRRYILGLVGFVSLILLGQEFLTPVNLRIVDGLVYGVPLSASNATITGGMLFATATLVLFNFRDVLGRWIKGRKMKERADIILFAAAIVVILIIALDYFSRLVGVFDDVVILLLLLALAHAVLVFTGVVAKNLDEGSGIKKDPKKIFTKSFVLKTTVVNALLFILVSYLMLGLVSSYFVSLKSQGDALLLEEDAMDFVDYFTEYNDEILRKANVSATQVNINEDAGEIGVTDMFRQLAGVIEKSFTFELIDTQGKYIFSPSDGVALGDKIRISEPVQSALRGESLSGIASRDGVGWVFQAAVPVLAADNTVLGAVVASSADDVYMLANNAVGELLYAEGLGFISRDKGIFYISGAGAEINEGGVVEDFSNARGSLSFEGRDDIQATGMPVLDSRDEVIGYAYSYISVATRDVAVVRILLTVALIVLLLIGIMVAILVFTSASTTRDIRRILDAVHKMMDGDYHATVPVTSADELGELSDAFNHMSKQIRERTQRIEEVLAQQRDFLNNAAHDIRNPLNHFRWALELLRFGDAGKLTPEQLELVEQMHRTTKQLTGLVQNIVDVSKLDDDRSSMNLASVDVLDVIDEVVGGVAIRIRQKELTCDWKSSEHGKVEVYVDKGMLERIITNLVGNAVKYTQKGGRIHIDVKHIDTAERSGRKGDFVKISVQDTGLGIPLADQRRIFSRFYRASNVRRGDIEGTGIGLYVVKQLVILQGGEVWFDSVEGKGTTFHVVMPVSRDAETKDGEQLKK